MGLIKRNNSKYWYAQFRLNGRVVIQSTKTTDKRLAEQIETKLRTEALRSQSFDLKDRIKVSDCVSVFCDAKKHLASYRHYLRYGRYAIESMTGDLYIDQITVRDLERFRTRLVSQNLKHQTVRHTLYFLRAALKYSKSSGYRVPDIDLPSMKQSVGRLRYLDYEEEQRLLNSLDPKRDIRKLPPYEKRSPRRNREFHDQYDFVVTLLDTGARHTEITTLEWKSVSLENRTIRLWRPKVRNQSVLYMSERLYQVLKRRHSVRDPNIPFVFHSKEGKAKPYVSGTARQIFDRAGLSDCSYHTLRHTLASRLIQNGLNIYEVKEILGHADIKTTMRYAHLERTDISLKAKQVLDQLNSTTSDTGIDTTFGMDSSP